jgi:hypothetical protein
MTSPSTVKSAHSNHKISGYCCVFLAACYVSAVVLLVGYLLVSLLW